MDHDANAGWESVIGIEIHAQLNTLSKLFCGCAVRFGDQPNTNTCPTCLGLPGALPVLNHRAVELGIRAALVLGLTVNETSVFARKHYFYPDLPKGYQISQYDRPFSENGKCEIMTAQRDESGRARHWTPKSVGITRLHLEEDAGKTMHDDLSRGNQHSYVDLNRAGTPLAEIVSEPDLRSSWEAYDYVNHVRRALRWVGASEADMEKGNLRCDSNVSVRRFGDAKWGVRVELKNLNSVRFMQRAIEYEISRQIRQLDSGNSVVQETRLWDERSNETRVMRLKEQSHDYRYFPEPDLPPLKITPKSIEEVTSSLPELPELRLKRFLAQYALSYDDAVLLTSDRDLADYFEVVAKTSENPRTSSNLIRTELLRELENTGTSVRESPISPSSLAELIRVVDEGRISGKQAKELLIHMFSSGKRATVLIEEQGLVQLTDYAELEKMVDEVISKSTKQVVEYRAGKSALLGFFVGQVMKLSGGRASPNVVNEILRTKLSDN